MWPTVRPVEPGVGYAIANTEMFYRLTAVTPLLTDAVWAAANQAVYTPCYAEEPFRVRGITMFHGSVVSGNIDLGIYAPDAEGKPGARIASIGSTAMATINTVIKHTLTTRTPRGLFYLGAAIDNTTARVFRVVALGTNGQNYQANIFTQSAAFPLPANATPVKTPTAAAVPVLSVVGL